MPAKSRPVRKSAVKQAPAPAGKARPSVNRKSQPAKPKTAQSGTRPPAKTTTRPPVKSSKVPSRRTSQAPPVSLGRPKVVGEELLDLVFKEDFHARQIFVFLGVRTVRELEQFQPEQIYERASQPIRESVERIRRRLALLNRSLDSDEAFALKFLESIAAQQPG